MTTQTEWFRGTGPYAGFFGGGGGEGVDCNNADERESAARIPFRSGSRGAA